MGTTRGIAFILILMAARVLFAQQATSEEIFREYIDIEDGFASNYISRIVVDDQNVKWLASRGGLHRYNGRDVKVFKPRGRYQELSNQDIRALLVDSKGRIWVGTRSGGFAIYDPITDSFVNVSKLIDPRQEIKRVVDILEDARGNFWVSVWGNGMYVLSDDGLSVLAHYSVTKTARDLEMDPSGNIWAVSINLITKYDPVEDRLVRYGVPIGAGSKLHYDHRTQQLLVGSIKGLYSFDPKTAELVELEEVMGVDLKGINSINVCDRGRIWVGSWTMGLHVSSTDRRGFQKISLLPSDQDNTDYETVLDIFFDENRTAWICTARGGIVKVRANDVVDHIANTFEKNIRLPDNNIMSLHIDENGGHWYGTWGGGAAYSPDGKEFEQLPGVGNIKIQAITPIYDKMAVSKVYGVTLHELNGDWKKRKPPGEALSMKVQDLFFDEERDEFWIGTQEHSLFVVDLATDPEMRNPIRIDQNAMNGVNQIIKGPNGHLWLGTNNGLYQSNPHRRSFVRVDLNDSFPSVIFITLAFDHDGKLWLGSPGGLIKARIVEGKPQVEKVYDSNDGLRNDFITAVGVDSDNNVWLGTPAGVATVQQGSDVAMSINSLNGSSINMRALSIAKGKLYFGTRKGVFAFEPEDISLTTEAPKVVYEWIRIDNDVVQVDEEINGRVLMDVAPNYLSSLQLTHRESVLTLGYAAIDYGDPAEISYSYRIAGLSDEWIDNGNSTEITLVRPAAGKYTMEVRASKNRLDFGEISTIDIRVLPAPWLSTWAISCYVLLAIGITLVIIRFILSRARLQSSLELAHVSKVKEQELSEAKLRFFTNISHELRTPLTLIVSPVSEMLNNSKVSKDIKQRLEYVEKNAGRLLDLINQLLDFRKADVGELQLRVASGNFIPFAREIFMSFKDYAKMEGLTYKFETDVKTLDLTFDRDKMEVVLCNLLSNAFKATEKGGNIKMKVKDGSDEILIAVVDDGIGISQEYQSKIFNRFFQIQDTESIKIVGSGIGLSLTHRIVELHGGSIEVTSEPGQGAEFAVRMPKGNAHFSKDAIVVDSNEAEDIGNYQLKPEGPTTNSDGQKESILVVDDNADIRNYLQTLLADDGYEISAAGDGKEALDQIEKIMPDLIVSDVMMPEVDGLELCRQIKSDLRTSHIPVILLTARSSTVHEVSGLKHGADDYIRKPFDASVVKTRISSLLDNRKKVRTNLLNKIRFEPSADLQVENADDKFIKDFSEFIEQNLDSSDIDIVQIADQFHMSQSTLYRKLKSMTGMSITGFIRSIRLKKGAELLVSSDLKLSAVAYSVGFNDYKYFKKTFTEQFGLSPRDYRSEKIYPK